MMEDAHLLGAEAPPERRGRRRAAAIALVVAAAAGIAVVRASASRREPPSSAGLSSLRQSLPDEEFDADRAALGRSDDATHPSGSDLVAHESGGADASQTGKVGKRNDETERKTQPRTTNHTTTHQAHAHSTASPKSSTDASSTRTLNSIAQIIE